MSQIVFAKKVLVLIQLPFVPLFLISQFGIGLSSHRYDCLYIVENGFYKRPTIAFLGVGIVYPLWNLLYLFTLWTHNKRLPKLLLSHSKSIYLTSISIFMAISTEHLLFSKS